MSRNKIDITFLNSAVTSHIHLLLRLITTIRVANKMDLNNHINFSISIKYIAIYKNIEY